MAPLRLLPVSKNVDFKGCLILTALGAAGGDAAPAEEKKEEKEEEESDEDMGFGLFD